MSDFSKVFIVLVIVIGAVLFIRFLLPVILVIGIGIWIYRSIKRNIMFSKSTPSNKENIATPKENINRQNSNNEKKVVDVDYEEI
ncbi:hypothetical protein [Clostridium manihotivorum]|uniref:Uncharacterized protein n=1 Tax=Clostridium manihotivorum TaxID=2320868 RepID=A0A410DYS1_9CLOT|nr:hypothetical protein [Clostridium manihotivorum]QAA34208.1 hypothetical protein C1I91_22650 [Clostridium manihotivorum]